MTPTQIQRQLALAGRAVVSLNKLTELLAAAQLAADALLPVRWSFDPGTPPDLMEYFRGGVSGGFRGLFFGAVLAMFFPPAASYFLAGGAIVGAVHAASRVEQGWRVRFVDAGHGQLLLDVRRIA